MFSQKLKNFEREISRKFKRFRKTFALHENEKRHFSANPTITYGTEPCEQQQHCFPH